MLELDVFGHFLNAVLFLGTVMIGLRPGPSGWALRVVAGVGWLLVGFQLEMTSMYLWAPLFLANDVWNFGDKWKNTKLKQVA